MKTFEHSIIDENITKEDIPKIILEQSLKYSVLSSQTAFFGKIKNKEKSGEEMKTIEIPITKAHPSKSQTQKLKGKKNSREGGFYSYANNNSSMACERKICEKVCQKISMRSSNMETDVPLSSMSSLSSTPVDFINEDDE